MNEPSTPKKKDAKKWLIAVLVAGLAAAVAAPRDRLPAALTALLAQLGGPPASVELVPSK